MLSRQKRYQIPDHVRAACSEFQKARSLHRRQHRQLARQLRIEKASISTRDGYLSTVPTLALTRLQEEYPPHRHDVCETEEILTIWADYRSTKKHPDKREARANGGSWPETTILDKTKLQKVVEADESAIIHDSKTGEVIAVVLRDVCGDPGILEWVTSIIQENVGWRRNVRVCVWYFLVGKWPMAD